MANDAADAKWLTGTGSQNPAMFVAAAVATLLVSLVAAWVPTGRATRIEPVMALKEE
jgi:ABC-type lipoprotein release transport system permease subunit